MLIFKPDTVLRWHRELVRRKRTFKRKGKPGRPAISPELEALIIRLVKENPRWGYDKIQKDQILACDFFTVETIWLKTI